ncbi:MAG: hypothetical protein SFU57_06030 [Gemmatimonadales bacterium]|nr:hypothetical protein [Gemmatimonadales bacterium]
MSQDLDTVEIRGITSSGDGVATLPDGMTVFVPRTAPGDRVTLTRIHRHKRFARATADKVVVPGPGRVPPPCPHYDRDQCGSCQVMHLDADTQRAVRARVVGDALRRLARLEVADPEVVPADQQLGYRAKVTFAVQNGRIGFHRTGRPEEVFEVERCLLARPALQELHSGVRRARGHLPPDATRLVLREDADGGLHVIVETPGGRAWQGGGAFHRVLASSGLKATIWWHPADGAPRAVAGSDTPWPATVFEQVHPAMGRTVRAAAIAALGDVTGAVVWDLYAGIGDATALLATAGARVTSVESDPRAVAFAESRGPTGPVRWQGKVEERLGQLPQPDAVLTNPPRTGMSAEVTAAINASPAHRVVYISCDPATLARDVTRLAERYRLVAVRAFDQFPQTTHVECVAVLEPR